MKLSRNLKAAAALTTALALILVPTAQAATLKAAGATSVATLIDKCKADYQKATGDSFDYPGGGSGAGKTAIDNGTVDFAFSDSKDTNAAKPATLIHIPAMVWPIGIMYNIPQLKTPLALSRETVAKIFARQITKWNDPAIAAENNRTVSTPVFKKDSAGLPVKDADGNPIVSRYVTKQIKVTLPNQPITVIVRSGNSGTSNNLTTAFSKVLPDVWTKSGSDSFTTAFPGDATADPVRLQSASGSAGVATLAKKIKYSITYAETNYAANYGLTLANVFNAAGKLVTPDNASAAAFVLQADVAADGGLTFNYNTTEPSVYPFTAVTYALALTDYKNADKAASVKNAISFHAFSCPKLYPNLGFAVIDPASDLGQKLNSQLAKLSK